MALADGVFLFQAATGTYIEGALLDTLWPAAALLVGVAAWQPARRQERAELCGRRGALIPAGFGLVAIALVRTDGVAAVLSMATLLLVTVRMALAFLENQTMLLHSRREAVTDALTGMGNRRLLMQDLDKALRGATPAEPWLLLLFDLNGFKSYNDTFGHPAGDHLLARMGQALEGAMAPHGRAYRMGGDEFCALVRPGRTGREPLVAAAAAALRVRGQGFEVGAALGMVLIPSEADTVEAALQTADRRMYLEKGEGRASASRQTRDVLLKTLQERQPDLHIHLSSVADLSVAVGRRLHMSSEELDETARAAELHDVGKVAIPDAILSKPGPLGARVVAVCDAYDAMTSDRPYRHPLSVDEAIAELRRSSGRQFDPRVVDAFCATIAETRPARDAAAPRVPQRSV